MEDKALNDVVLASKYSSPHPSANLNQLFLWPMGRQRSGCDYLGYISYFNSGCRANVVDRDDSDCCSTYGHNSTQIIS
jgi:hypothetical protein